MSPLRELDKNEMTRLEGGHGPFFNAWLDSLAAFLASLLDALRGFIQRRT